MKVFRISKRKSLENAIDTIAMTLSPAIIEELTYLNNSGGVPSNIFLSEEKRMFYSPVLIPDQRISRVNKTTGEEFAIEVSAEEIERARIDFMKSDTATKSFNHEHDSNKPIEGITVVDNWIIKDKDNDQSNSLGYDLPEGTWMMGAYIDNDEVIDKIKAGEYKGISIEGLFENYELIEENGKQVQLNKQTIMNKLETTMGELLVALKSIGKTKLASIEVGEGVVLYTAGEFSEGVMVYSDPEMTIAAEGEFTVNGRKMTISAGSLVSIEEAIEEAAAEEASAGAELALAQAEATVKLSEEVTALKAENETLKTQLSELAESVAKHTTLLSKVEQASNENVINLKAEESAPSKFQELLSKAKN